RRRGRGGPGPGDAPVRQRRVGRGSGRERRGRGRRRRVVQRLGAHVGEGWLIGHGKGPRRRVRAGAPGRERTGARTCHTGQGKRHLRGRQPKSRAPKNGGSASVREGGRAPPPSRYTRYTEYTDSAPRSPAGTAWLSLPCPNCSCCS